MSSKCRPVVGSSNRNRCPCAPTRRGFSSPRPDNRRASDAAPRRRTAWARAGPGAGNPVRHRPAPAAGGPDLVHGPRRTRSASCDGQVEHVGDGLRRGRRLRRPASRTSSTSARKRRPLQSGQRRYTSDRNCISTCSKPLPPQVGQRPSPRVEAEGAGGVAALERHAARAANSARMRVERADVTRRVGARRPADGRLVTSTTSSISSAPSERCAPGVSVVLPFGFQQRRMQHVLHQRRFAAARHAGDADQAPSGIATSMSSDCVRSRRESRGAVPVRASLRRDAVVAVPAPGQAFGGQRCASDFSSSSSACRRTRPRRRARPALGPCRACGRRRT